MHKKQVKFIVNPFAGVGKKGDFREQVDLHLDKSLFDFAIEYTTHAGHAVDISKKAIKENFDIIVAVGGDGSVNEIASTLINTNKILGIIPAGSGNGFATYLGYSRNIGNALKSFNTAKTITIDTCLLNERPFVNVAGVGFDAWVAYKTKKQASRGFFGYTKAALKETMSYQPKKYTITIDGKEIEREALSIEIANATMFGYNMKIAPLAKLDDGLIDLVIIKKAPKMRYFLSMLRFPMGNIHKSSLVEYYTAKEIKIVAHEECAAHLDGEGFFPCRILNFSVKNLSLQVLKPQN